MLKKIVSNTVQSLSYSNLNLDIYFHCKNLMRASTIDIILEKLESGECSDEEEGRLIREKITLDKKVMDLSKVLGVVILPK